MHSAQNLHSVNDVGSPCYVNSAQAAARFIHVAKFKKKKKQVQKDGRKKKELTTFLQHITI